MPNFGDKIHKLAKLLSYSDQMQVYEQLITHWDKDSGVVLLCLMSLIESEASNSLGFIEQMMF